ncbi:MAG: sigma-54-dependent Fis family transcriptional regulator [Desulfobulbaceae bacterium]|nr:sigma-54-dependent Fis family transcriptional regulator [Desulfobulbaceae bacterium]
MTVRILVVDDDPALAAMLVKKIEREGYTAQAVNTLQQGLRIARQESCDIVLLDVVMPDGNGLDYLPEFKKCRFCPEVIIVTGYGGRDGAEIAIRGGAWSYIEKQKVIHDLPLHLKRALQYREEKKKFKVASVALKRKKIIGESDAIQRSFDALASSAASDASVLITGETGTGKELFARAVHDNSSRANGKFVVVDCASLPVNLMESVLFGHVKGAFTGANLPREGIIKLADQGTLFLDEIGELPLAMQKTFLRVLQERSYRPLGSDKEVTSKFRLVAATNRNLVEMVDQKTFRQDLLFRLKGLEMHLPPLRERKEDIKELVIFWLNKLCDRHGQESKGMAPDFVEGLRTHDWPGNVRELFQTLEQVFAGAADVPTLFSVHLPDNFRIRMLQAGIHSVLPRKEKERVHRPLQEMRTWRDHKAMVEEEYICDLMKGCRGNVKEACRISGISRARIYQLINRHSVSGNCSPTPSKD